MKSIAIITLLTLSSAAGWAGECTADCQYMEVENDGTIFNTVVTLHSSASNQTEARISITAQCREEFGGQIASRIQCK